MALRLGREHRAGVQRVGHDSGGGVVECDVFDEAVAGHFADIVGDGGEGGGGGVGGETCGAD